MPGSTERVETPDGDFVDLGWPRSGLPSDAPVGLVLHGLEGSVRSGYVVHACRALAARGIRGVGLNFRSCGPEANRLPRFYHAGDTADLDAVVRSLRAAYPGARVGAVGFSLGANVLLKWLGETGTGCPIDAAVAVSPPFDLAAGSRALERRMGPVYARFFLRSLRAKLSARADALDGRCAITRGGRARTLREFDDAITAPLHGFDNAARYYRECSSAQFIPAIRIPTLVLHSDDDPFLPAEAIPRDAMRRNPQIVDGLTTRGGHVGFVAGPLWTPQFWAEAEAARFLATHVHA